MTTLLQRHVALVEKKLDVITKADAFADRLSEVLKHGIPGFIVKSSVLAPTPKQARSIHTQVAGETGRHLRSLFPEKTVRVFHDNGFDGLGQASIGLLHHDYEVTRNGIQPEELGMELTVHTTLSGGGLVMLGAFGENPTLAASLVDKDDSSTVAYPANPDHLHNLVTNGLVDPELMRPEVYVGPLSAGDTVIAAEGGSSTAWHRYDTDSELGTREVMVSVVQNPISPNSLLTHGFFLAP